MNTNSTHTISGTIGVVCNNANTSFNQETTPTFEPVMLIPLRPAGFAIINPEDYPLIAPYNWRMARIKKKHLYAIATTKKNGKTVTVLMHRVILGLTNGEEGDHKNYNGLDNRRSNIRPATTSQNQQYQRPKPNGTSKYKGVCKFKDNWRAQIRINGKRKWLGDYRTQIEAALAYDKAAIKHFGEFAQPNFKGDIHNQ